MASNGDAGPSRYFRAEGVEADLGSRAARGGAVAVASQALRFLLTAAGTIVLARLLTPGDYGLIGMATAVIGFAGIFRDAGLAQATVQRKRINHRQVSTIFWINACLGLAIMLAVIAVAPLVGMFYRAPQVGSITAMFALGFPIGALGAQHAALLRRTLRFGALAVCEVASATIGLATAIVLAWSGAQYWALLYGRLAEVLAFTVGVWLATGWRPALPSRKADVRAMLVFGGNLTGFSVANYFARNLDNLLIGRYWGAAELGVYAKAYQLLLVPIRQLNMPMSAVAVPALSKLVDDPARYRRAYLRLLEKVAMITMPAIALAMASADWLVVVVLGSQWAAVGKVFAVLAPTALLQPVANTVGWLFVSQDRTREMFRWGVLSSSLIALGILAGLPWGSVGVAASYSVTTLLVVRPLLFRFVGRSGPVRTSDLYRTIAPALLASLAVLFVLGGLRYLLGAVDPAAGVAILLGAALLATPLALSVFPAGRRALRDLVGVIRQVSTRAP